MRERGIALLNSSAAQPATATALPEAIELSMKKTKTADAADGTADRLSQLTLPEVHARLSQPSFQLSAQSLLDDMGILEQWRSLQHPSNSVRGAMLKLGSRWDVKGKVQGRKRPPADVAKELEERMREHGIAVLNSSGAAVTLETLPLVVLSVVTNCTATWTDTIALTSCSPGLRSTLAGERAMTLNQGSLWVEMMGDANVEALQNKELDAYFDQLHASPQRCDSDLDSVAS